MWLASNPQIVKVLDQFEMGVADLAGRQKLPERYETSTPLPSAMCSEIARSTSNRNGGRYRIGTMGGFNLNPQTPLTRRWPRKSK